MFKFLKKLVLFLVLAVLGLGAYRHISKKEIILIGHDSAGVSAYPYYEILGKYNVNISSYSPHLDSYIDADGYIFVGGQDFDPSIYGSDNYDLVEDFVTSEDYADLEFLDKAIKDKKPILAICRGMQLINIYYGGTLYEDIKSQFETSISHREGQTLPTTP